MLLTLRNNIMIKFVLPLIVLLSAPFAVNAQEKTTYQLSTHILDIHSGKPASGVIIKLYQKNSDNAWQEIDSGTTDSNGRITDFLPQDKDNSGIYKLSFETKEYFEKQNVSSIYPYVDVVFQIEGNSHYHIPLTMSANGYATYRGN